MCIKLSQPKDSVCVLHVKQGKGQVDRIQHILDLHGNNQAKLFVVDFKQQTQETIINFINQHETISFDFVFVVFV
jgi:hypothetical protein